MLTKDTANLYLTAILETLAQAGPAPSGTLYGALMGRMSMDDYTLLIDLAVRGELLAKTGAMLALTDKGRGVVAKIAAHRAA